MYRLFLKVLFALAIALLSFNLTACSLPQVSAEDRLFLNLSLDFLDAYELPKSDFQDTRVGGLSGITYDRQSDRFYVVSDDRSEFAPARFYTVKLNLDTANLERLGIQNVAIEKVITLKADDGNPYAKGTIDPEGIAISPLRSLYISSEGVARDDIPPFIHEFDLATGALKNKLPIPNRYVPKEVEGVRQGVRDNLGFEALTLNPGGASPTFLEPFRLFAATESALSQDVPEENAGTLPARSRFLHYLIGDELPTLISEHLYLVEPLPQGAIANGLTEILTLDQAGHFLSIERAYGPSGFTIRIFEIATGGATDTSGITTLRGDITGIQPIRKRLLLDLKDLNLRLDNLEGMTLGPLLPDGTQSLVLISDDNFSNSQVSQVLLFRLNGWTRQ